MTRTRGLGFYKNSDIYSGSTNEQIQVVINRSHMIRLILYGAHIMDHILLMGMWNSTRE